MIGGVSPDGLHPSHLALIAPTVSPPVLMALAAHPRFAARFRVLLPTALAGPEPGEASDRATPDRTPPDRMPTEWLALRTATRIETAGLMMGAAWHARAIGRCIGSDMVGALEAAVGREVRIYGLRSAALAMAPADTPLPSEKAATELVARIRVDGLRCLVRWRDELAEPLRALAMLKLPRVGLPAAATAEADPIIADVAERVMGDVAEPVPHGG